jgi:CHAD domain-containing protein
MNGMPEGTESGLCWLGMRQLPPLLEAFEKEIAGVRVAEDIEYIHRMRVASRRLRAAFPLFRSCFPAKQYARWMDAIADITRALGEARDADVQIAFLLKYRKKNGNLRKNGPYIQTGTENPLDLAINYLLQDLQKRRKQLQVRVLAALDALEKSGVIAEIRTTIAKKLVTSWRIPARAPAYGIPTVAAFRISSRLMAMRSFEPWISHADAVAEHHAMRIAAKKLRYTMEVYGPVYRLGLTKPHARVKMVQEILGDIHDCDVWIDQVTRLLLRERGHLRSETEGKRPDTATLAGLRRFLKEREQKRVLLHRRFMRYWQSLTNNGIWDELVQTLAYGRKKRFIPAYAVSDDEYRSACETLAATYPEGLPHHRTVTRLALMLFDSLQPLHNLTRHDRLLLECAGMLHDIGWLRGEKRHNARSARMIFSSESLPMDIIDRSAVGLIALAHRGPVQTESHPLFSLVPPGERTKVIQLAAILRVADGLDFLHMGSVQEVHCVTDREAIYCDVISPVNVPRERERARLKSGLFINAFKRELVIR